MMMIESFAFIRQKKDIYILRTVEWKKIIEIAVDPKRQRGRRSTLISNPSPEQPTIYEENLPIPTCALYPPTGNFMHFPMNLK